MFGQPEVFFPELEVVNKTFPVDSRRYFFIKVLCFFTILLLFSTNILNRNNSAPFFSLLCINISYSTILQNLILSNNERYKHAIYLKDKFLSTTMDDLSVVVEKFKIYRGVGDEQWLLL